MKHINRYLPLNLSPNSQKLLNRLEPSIPFIVIIVFCWWVLTCPYEITKDEPLQSLAARRVILQPKDQICKENPNLLIFVHTRTDEIDRRNEWRRNYGRLARKYKYGIVFSLGLSNDASVNADIENESRIYGDILQADFIDSYKNITHKHLLDLRYAVTLVCSKVAVIFKADDDLVLNVRKLNEIVKKMMKEEEQRQETHEPRKIWCKLTPNVTIQRMSNQKWAIPRSRLSETTYPDYCSGMGIFYPRSAVPNLLKAAEHQLWLWLDDVFMTGYLRLAAGVSLMDISKEYEAEFDGADLTLFKEGHAAFRYVDKRADTDKLFHLVNDLA